MLAVTRDIKSLKIQGAEHIAVAAVSALQSVLRQYRTSPQLHHKLAAAHAELVSARPTEPFLRNCLNAVIHTDGEALTAADIAKRIGLVLTHIKTADEHITNFALPAIPTAGNVYTHCHSSTVTRILHEAARRKYRITLHQTETRPRYQGRITAAELASVMPVHHYVDSAMRLAIRECQVALLGADAISDEGKVVNKIGSELVAETAARFDVPLYICTNSWKFDPATVHGFVEPIEERDAKEVWSNPPRGVRIQNPAFERISPNLITGIISELGVFKPKVFVRVVQERYPLLEH